MFHEVVLVGGYKNRTRVSVDDRLDVLQFPVPDLDYKYGPYSNEGNKSFHELETEIYRVHRVSNGDHWWFIGVHDSMNLTEALNLIIGSYCDA